MKMTDEVEAVMGGVRMGVNVDIKRTDGESQLLILWVVVVMVSCNQSEYLMPADCSTWTRTIGRPNISNESLFLPQLCQAILLHHA